MRVDLRSRLVYEPRELRFGTSGRRGEVVHLTQLEIYVNVLAELEYLQSLSARQGRIERGDEFYFARDLRPSSTAIAGAVQQAIRDSGMTPVNLGLIPAPAVTLYGLLHGRGSMMVTGSHIPFDRNGYKTNSAKGELLKSDEAPIGEHVRAVRERIYRQPYDDSPFNERGAFKRPHAVIPPVGAGEAAYLARYLDFFGAGSLRGMRVLVYQHSAVGRDLLVDILQKLGADAAPCGRSETFVPIDTENIDDAQLAAIQALVDRHGPADAVVSTDGDSDRPLILGITPEGRAHFFGGDVVGMVAAEFLGADAVVVPVTCNDAIDRGPLRGILETKTRIGSPYVIAGMEEARRRGKRAVCGWEANGGFLTGSDIERNGRWLRALPTRDAVLPILCTLLAARQKGLFAVFDALPKRFSRAALLKNFSRAKSLAILEQFGAPECLAQFFTPDFGFAPIIAVDYTDGVRISFANGDVAHLRPSGNADEFRIYAVADTQERADAITKIGVKEPDGILRNMEKSIASHQRIPDP